MLSQSWKKLQDHIRWNDDQSLEERKKEKAAIIHMQKQRKHLWEMETSLFYQIIEMSQKSTLHMVTLAWICWVYTKDPPSLKIEHWNSRKNKSSSRAKGSSLLLVCFFTSGPCRLQICWLLEKGMEKSGIATCRWSFKEQFRQDSAPVCHESHQDMMTWRTECWQKPWTSSPLVC